MASAPWPLNYAIQPPEPFSPPRRWWSHRYYRGPSNGTAQILYSRTRDHSEAIAQQFKDEPVLGFDMEWPWDPHQTPAAFRASPLQEKVALIQLACEDKIALFHVALHEGNKPDHLIAPTLKGIIENPTLVKTGVGIMNNDMKRLREHFELQPQGVFELSHLHRLVTQGAQYPHPITTQLCKLATMVETHLGMPLFKGQVRASAWSRRLEAEQIEYAADDAYASFMLYHCMNAKRLALAPVPRMPRLAETYLPFSLAPIQAVQFVVEQPKLIHQLSDRFRNSRFSPSEGQIKRQFSRLWRQLCRRRRDLARQRAVDPDSVATYTACRQMAALLPTNPAELRKQIHRFADGDRCRLYGPEFLGIVAAHLAQHPEARGRYRWYVQ
ncbi:ribonuclease H-like domain-containing protein [Xylariomycetidae sp. FL0641]|nr:ribonuclease H-like domain-containing protein [Xylariomycetidae sp. FL0641]